MRILFTPLLYLRISHPGKRLFDWVLPLLGAILLFAASELVGFGGTLTGKDGLIGLVTPIAGLLSGFFFAALTATATFPGPRLDEQLDGTPATLEYRQGGERIRSHLSRRRYLCFLFGYLTWMALVLFLVGTLAAMLTPGIARLLSPEQAWLLGRCLSFIYYAILTHVAVTTFVGLHFLSERIHREAPKRVDPPK